MNPSSRNKITKGGLRQAQARWQQPKMDNIKAITKLILSYFKSDWDINDYPLRVRFQEASRTEENVPAYCIQIINWWTMTGLGDTEKAALDNLHHNFTEFKKLKPLPRPGTDAPLEFAATSSIDKYEDVAVDFFEKVLEMDYYECFISDESSLHDFGFDYDELRQKTLDNFKLDIDTVEHAIIVDILEKIKLNETAAANNH